MGGILHYGENGVACWTRPLQYLCLSDIFVCGSLSRIQNESNNFFGGKFWSQNLILFIVINQSPSV